MNIQQMKAEFDKWEDIIDLRRIVKVGNPIQRLEAEVKLKHYWYVWERCWPIAFEKRDYTRIVGNIDG